MIKFVLGEIMKKFRFKLNAVSLIMLIVGVLLSICCIVWNIFNITAYFRLNIDATLKLVSYFLVIAVALLAGGLCVSVLAFSRYTVTQKYLLLNLGVLRSKTPVCDITEIAYFKKQNKLVCYFGEDKFSVIVIDQKEFDDFINALREQNGKIVYENKTSV